MRPTLPRFTVRRLMVVVAIVAVIPAYLISLKGSYWIGFANVPLRFTMLDGASGRPIAGAIVRLPGNIVYESAPTGDEGKTAVDVKVMSSGRESILRKTRQADFSSWRIRVLAPGYKTYLGILEDRTQDSRFHEENPDPPPIVIRMERESDSPEPE